MYVMIITKEYEAVDLRRNGGVMGRCERRRKRGGNDMNIVS